MADNPRIEDLKRRVQSDPASIAFAALAEEYRRASQFEEAIATCKAGLQRHPAYLSAHVTLGRALIEIGKYDDARKELEYVLKVAPENLAAIRALAEIHHRRGDGSEPYEHHPPASVADAGAAQTPQKTPAMPTSSRKAEPAAKVPLAKVPLARSEPAARAAEPEPPKARPVVAAPAIRPAIKVDVPSPADPALAGLEEFLAAILRARREHDGASQTARR
jgi:tetratricopeptide (TPR) repeat protein